jgi:hypothetical protein
MSTITSCTLLDAQTLNLNYKMNIYYLFYLKHLYPIYRLSSISALTINFHSSKSMVPSLLSLKYI